MRNLKTLDFAAFFALMCAAVLTILSIRNTGNVTYTSFLNHFLSGLLLVTVSFAAGGLRNRFPKITDALFAAALTIFLYETWPHTFFDDAGFIMRYLDNLKEGVWFHYNAGEGPVFGISGIIHGMLASVWVTFFQMTPERALHVSNLMGLFACVWLLAAIIRKLTENVVLGYASAAVVILFSKSFCDVLFTGMETPLHIAFILAALYFLVHGNTKGFYLFSSLSIISKLDAVPVTGFLMLIYAARRLQKIKIPQLINEEWKSITFFFLVPLLLWIVAAYFYFGSPFPQSAKAKVLYHSGAASSRFPFLEGFTGDIYKYPMLILWLLFFLIQLLLVKRTNGKSVTLHFSLGWMFVGIMLLYYFYNPNERMLWYYALPDFLLVGQCVYSSVWIASWAKDWKKFLMPVLLIPFWTIYLKPDAEGAKNWMYVYLERVERERYEVGKFIAKEGLPSDTLIAWHGLLARPFPGFVIDGTGLNSKLAVDFKLNRDSLLAELNPRFGIHHGYPQINASFSEHGYKIKGMFGDVTLENWPAWVWWEKDRYSDVAFRSVVVSDSLIAEGKVTFRQNPLKVEGRMIEMLIPVRKNNGIDLWVVFEGRVHTDRVIQVLVWKQQALWKEIYVTIPAYGMESYPSLYTFGDKINLSGPKDSLTDAYLKVQFLPTGEDTSVKINNPIIEYGGVKSL